MYVVGLCIILVCLLEVTTSAEVEYHLLEEQLPGFVLGNVADDTNLKTTINESEFRLLRFEIMKEGSQYADWFSIDEKSGQLETSESIDRETVCSTSKQCVLLLNIFIYKESKDDPDNVDLFQAFQVNVILDDLNDNDPNFPKSELSLSIPESSEVGFVLSITSATDPDSGVNNGVTSYQLLADDDTFLLQTPDVNGGNLGIVVNKNLDRETKSFFRLTIIAKDGGQPPRTGSVIINVTVLDTNDNSPIFEAQQYDVSVPENMPSATTVLRVTAHDKDLNENGEIKYRFSSRSSDKVKESFDVDEFSGDISIKTKIDFEQETEFQFTVEAYDQGATSKTAQTAVKINILDLNDNAPQIHINLPPGGSDVSETAEVDRYIAYVETFDPDSGENGTVTCSIDNDYFRLESIITDMYKIKLSTKLDRETIENHNIKIVCSDNGNPKQSNFTILSIHVLDDNDNRPEFSQDTYNLNFPENNKIGDVVGMVTATDKDIGEHARITYHIEHNFDMDYFIINSATGLITSNYSFDRETTSSYNFQVVAEDSGQRSFTERASVQVTITDKNDNSPKFSENNYVFYIDEGQQPGTEVGNVTVNDLDIGSNGDISFLQDFPYTDVLVIDSQTGKIKTKIVLDRETKSRYVFELKAQDKGVPSLTDTTTVEIYVTDINDNVPMITFPTNSNNTVYVPLTTTVGTIIAKINVVDIDEGANAELTYLIMQGDKRRIFRMNNLTGIVTVDKLIDESDSGTYTLLIAVQDNGIPQLTAWTSLVLIIQDDNGRKNMIIQDDNGRKNMIIAIAVATVTFALSVAMVLTIFVIRRRDSLKEKEKELQMKSEKQQNASGWLKCLSPPSRDNQRTNTGEKVKDTNKHIDFTNNTDMQPMVHDSGSTSSDDSKSFGPGSNPNLTKIDNNLKDRYGEMSPREQDSGFGESLERRGLQELKAPSEKRCQFLDSRGIRIPSPYLDTSLPTRCLKKHEKPSYNRNYSLDEQALREKEKSNLQQLSSSFNAGSTSGMNSELYTISEQNYTQKSPFGFHSLQRRPHGSSKSINSKYSFKDSKRRELPTISATPEPELPVSYDFDTTNHLSHALERHSQSDNHIDRNHDYFYMPNLRTFDPQIDNCSEDGRSPRSDIYNESHHSDNFAPQNSRTDTQTENSRFYNQNSYDGKECVVLNNALNYDIVV